MLELDVPEIVPISGGRVTDPPLQFMPLCGWIAGDSDPYQFIEVC